MPDLHAYLVFDGTTAEAMRFYERTFNGKLQLMTMGESPMAAQTPPGGMNRIMHARLEFPGGVLMASDAMMGKPYEGMHGFSLSISFPTPAEAKKIWDALAAGGNIIMPLEKTFWAEAFGMLVDRFGTPWMINCEAPRG